MPSERAAEVVAAAGRLLDAEGAHALTMRRLADEVGMRAPSLDKHLPGKDALHRALVVEALHGLGAAMAAAGSSLTSRSAWATAPSPSPTRTATA